MYFLICVRDKDNFDPLHFFMACNDFPKPSTLVIHYQLGNEQKSRLPTGFLKNAFYEMCVNDKFKEHIFIFLPLCVVPYI